LDIKERIEKEYNQSVYYKDTAEQFSKRILDLFEPVTLEELTDEETNSIVEAEYKKACDLSTQYKTSLSECFWSDNPGGRRRWFNTEYKNILLGAMAQATIAKNSKEQLYRIKEG